MQAEVSSVSRKRFTVDNYYRMLDAGILRGDDRVELIDGEVLEMSPIGARHAATVYCFQAVLQKALADRAMIRVQSPVHFDDFNEPEPDIAVVRTRTDMYASAHPTPADVRLLVEVSDSTLTFDRTVKARLYAIARIPEYWIAELERNRVIVHRGPEGEAYRTVTEFGPDDTLGPAAYPDVEVAVSRFLP
jgi:hypothetical protein